METLNYLTEGECIQLKGLEVKHNAMFPAGLTIKANIEIKNNDGEYGLDYITGNLFALKGNAASRVTVVDVSKGEVMWHVDNCYDYNGLCIGDKNAIYIARECNDKRYLTAHNPATGKELWLCSLSTDAKQFSTALVQTGEHIFHSNAETIFTIEKKTGKLVSYTKLLNEDPTQERTQRYLIPWNGKIIVPRKQVKNKQTTLVLEIYNPFAAYGYMGSLVELDGDVQPYGYILNGEMLYFFTSAGILYKIDLSQKKIMDKTCFIFDEESTSRYLSRFYTWNNRLYFIYRCEENAGNESNNGNIHNFAVIYNMKNEEIYFSEKVIKSFPIAEQFRGNYIYRLGSNRLFITSPDQNAILAELELPLYGEDENDSYHHEAGDSAMQIIGNTIFLLQRGGMGKENSCKLYCIG